MKNRNEKEEDKNLQITSRDFLIYRNANDDVKVEVLLINNDIWLTQNLIADLFGVARSTITDHINNILKSEELREENTVGKTDVVNSKKPVKIYNLDMIIAVGYRVNSKKATDFRIWATKILKEYMIKGVVMDDEKINNKKKYKYYEIKVSIRDTHPPVWRRLQIPAGITFHELNAIIQLAFDWCGYHLYEFEVGATLHEQGEFIGIPDEDSEWYGRETIDATKIKIDKFFKEYKKMKYTYDFGDDWIHDITIEKEIETNIKLQNPICIKAKMADLPEDCGGSWGYEELLEILDNPKHERYQEMKEWIENGYSNWNDDRTFVDLEEINMRLEDYKEHAKFLLGE